VRFTASRTRPTWESHGDVGARSRTLGPLPRCNPIRPTGPAHPFGSQRPPAKIDPQVSLSARGGLGCNGVRRDPSPYGAQALVRSNTRLPQGRTNFWPADRAEGTDVLGSERTAASRSPRPRFARSRVLPAFSRFPRIEVGKKSNKGLPSMRLKARVAYHRGSAQKLWSAKCLNAWRCR
jgi:hypothetical protein